MHPDLYLEVTDLLVNDPDAGIIKVSTQVFDDFVPDSHIMVEFVDELPGIIQEYVIKSQDSEGITMEWLSSVLA